jgi:hypothetical protein
VTFLIMEVNEKNIHKKEEKVIKCRINFLANEFHLATVKILKI